MELTGQDGNAFAIMGRVAMAMRKAGVSKREVNAYLEEATTGDYDDLLPSPCNTSR